MFSNIKLKLVLKFKNISQKDLAIRIGVSTAAVCQYVKGTKTPSLNTFIKILIALDVGYNDLIDKN